MSADEYMMTAEELRLHRRKRRRILLIVLVLVLVIVGAFFGARPAGNAIKAWQARRHAQRAFAFIDKEQWNDAQKEATAAIQLKQDEPESLRAVARFLSRVRNPEALEFWKQLDQRHLLTRGDRRDQVAVALAANDVTTTENGLTDLLTRKDSPPTSADWLLAAQAAQQKGLPDEARTFANKILNDAKADERAQLQAAFVVLSVTPREEPDGAAAWTRLNKLAEGKSKPALDALVILAQQALSAKTAASGAEPTARSEDRGQRTEDSQNKSEGNNAERSTPNVQRPTAEGREQSNPEIRNLSEPSAPPSQRPKSEIQTSPLQTSNSQLPSPSLNNDELITNNGEPKTALTLAQSLENHPLAVASHKLLALDLRIHADESQRDALVNRAITQWKNADATSLTALATWLNGKGEYQLMLDSIPLEKALQSRDLFLQHVDALGALNRWDEIRQLLVNERFPLDQTVEHMYLARCYAQLGEKTASENSWKRALEGSGGDAGKLVALGEYAEKNGAIDIAEAAYAGAVTAAPKSRAGHQGRLRLAQAQRDTKKMHGILSEMLTLWPNDPAIENDEAYTRLLLQSREGESRTAKVENAGSTPEKTRADVTSHTSDVPGQRADVLPLPSPSSQSPQPLNSSTSASPPPTSSSQLPAPAELEAIEKLAERLVQLNPRSLPHRTLLALARLRQNQFTEALEVYNNIQVAANALTPSALAVHAAVLFANGRVDEAKNEAAQVPPDRLLPEEEALIQGLRE
jgi:hypothetical protein